MEVPPDDPDTRLSPGYRATRPQLLLLQHCPDGQLLQSANIDRCSAWPERTQKEYTHRPTTCPGDKRHVPPPTSVPAWRLTFLAFPTSLTFLAIIEIHTLACSWP